MKKRFWTRLISAVLTMAMAFSILAVPASAASEGNSWAVGAVNRDGTKTWITEKYAWQSLKEKYPEMPDAQLKMVLAEMKKAMLNPEDQEVKTEEWVGEKIPDSAILGVTLADATVTYWFDSESYADRFCGLLEAGTQITGYDGGFVVFEDGTEIYVAGYAGTPVVGDGTTPDPDDSTGTTEPDNPVVTPEPDEKVDWNWALVAEGEGVEGYAWTPAIVFAQQFAQQMGIELSDITAAQMEEIKKVAATRGDVEPITYNEEAYLGFSNSKEEEPSWFTEEAVTKIFEADEAELSDTVLALDENGNLILKDSDGKELATAKPIGSAEEPEPKPEPEPEPEPSTRVVTVIGLPANDDEVGLGEAFSDLYVWLPFAEELSAGIKSYVEEAGGLIRYSVEIPTDIYAGFSSSLDGKICWYTVKQIQEVKREDIQKVTLDEETGTLTAILTEGTASAGAAATTPGVNEATPSKPTETKPAAGGSSSDDTAVVLAAVGAAAAATGVYLYTHPEKVEAIKDFFADLSANVQAKVQQLTTNVKGAFGIIIPDREDDEEEEPVAAAVEEAQAA